MKSQQSLRGGVMVALGTALFAAANLGIATQAAAPTYERTLAGIRLASSAKTILAKYGNPNEVVIGDIGIRQPAGGQGTPGGGGPSMAGGGAEGGDFGGPNAGVGGALGAAMGPMGRSGGMPVGGFGGAAGGYPGGIPGDAEGGKGGFGGPSLPGAGGSFGGGSVGPFGNTSSTVAREQEVTWIYNRKSYDKKGAAQLVSYEFLVGPDGNVEQIRASGYTGGSVRTNRGIGLGSTYKDVVRAYGFPEEHQVYGNALVASYKNRAHVSFQFLNDRVLNGNVTNPGNKVIGITIATVE